VIRLAIRVRGEQAELALAELLDLAPSGVEEVRLADQTVEYAAYGAPGELPTLPDLKAAVGGALVDVSSSEVADDWQERWRRFHRPVLIEAPAGPAQDGRAVSALRVRPPWEEPGAGRGDVEEIVIDPGQAFGTGAHASTRLCLALLLELAAMERPSGPLLDVGTGSGVLAIAAARLGFAPVLALDNERASVEAAGANAAANGAEIAVRPFDLRRQTLPWLDGEDGPAGPVVVIANLLGPLLLELARTMPGAPAHLLAGGLLPEQCEQTAGAFAARLCMRERERRRCGQWAALWLTGPHGSRSLEEDR
jgi:ribosomal protein L11 methyltransferase